MVLGRVGAGGQLHPDAARPEVFEGGGGAGVEEPVEEEGVAVGVAGGTGVEGEVGAGFDLDLGRMVGAAGEAPGEAGDHFLLDVFTPAVGGDEVGVGVVGIRVGVEGVLPAEALGVEGSHAAAPAAEFGEVGVVEAVGKEEEEAGGIAFLDAVDGAEAADPDIAAAVVGVEGAQGAAVGVDLGGDPISAGEAEVAAAVHAADAEAAGHVIEGGPFRGDAGAGGILLADAVDAEAAGGGFAAGGAELVEGLGEIGAAAPDEDPEGAGVGFEDLLDEPVGGGGVFAGAEAEGGVDFGASDGLARVDETVEGGR